MLYDYDFVGGVNFFIKLLFEVGGFLKVCFLVDGLDDWYVIYLISVVLFDIK